MQKGGAPRRLHGVLACDVVCVGPRRWHLLVCLGRLTLTLIGIQRKKHSAVLGKQTINLDSVFSEILPAVDLGLVHPARQLEVPPGQPCVLGAERLRLGRIPQGAILSRVISIRNCLPTSVRI